MSSYQYRNSHYKDKKVLQPSYFYNANTYTKKVTVLILKQGRGRLFQYSNIKTVTVLPILGIIRIRWSRSIIRIRWSRDRLIFIMEIPIPRDSFYTEARPRMFAPGAVCYMLCSCKHKLWWVIVLTNHSNKYTVQRWVVGQKPIIQVWWAFC